MIQKDARRLRVGVLGCGPIAQAAHFESCTKARNADLYAICDVAMDLLDRMAATHAPVQTYSEYAAMLADPMVEAVIVATSDAFHVTAATVALAAGKHVLCEKPLGVSVEEAEALRERVRASGLVLQVGHMKRFDAGLQEGQAFARDSLGQHLAYKGWYCDNTHRYINTDAVQPLIVTSAAARKPAADPKADLARYYMLAHGSHLLDTARFFCGPIERVEARLHQKFGAYCWFVDVGFASGALGHLDLTIGLRGDWNEGLWLHGEHGNIAARTYNPWFYRSSEVDIFDERTATTRRPLGADGHFYRRQLEGFADTILTGMPMRGADVEDGVASVRGMVAVAESVRSGRAVELEAVSGPV